MKTFCPNCEKETECEFRAELYWCSECDEDFASYEKYWKKQACAAVKHMLEMTSFLRHIMTLGLLRGSPRLTTRALEILDGFETSDIDVSMTDDVLTTIKTEVKELRYKTSEQEKFIWWIWNVYAKNVGDLISAINAACTYESADAAKNGYYGLPMTCWQTISYLKEYTDGIYNGTYLKDAGRKNTPTDGGE